jgi:hypothetical protein
MTGRLSLLVGLALSISVLMGCGSQEEPRQSDSSLVMPSGKITRPLTGTPCSGTGGVVVTPCPAKIGKSVVEITVGGPRVVYSGIGCVDEPFGCKQVNNLQWNLSRVHHRGCWERLNKVFGRNVRKRDVGYFILELVKGGC